jgi:hypothetical protein
MAAREIGVRKMRGGEECALSIPLLDQQDFALVHNCESDQAVPS